MCVVESGPEGMLQKGRVSKPERPRDAALSLRQWRRVMRVYRYRCMKGVAKLEA